MGEPQKHRWQKLAGVHPTLQARVQLICTAMEVLGFTMIVTDGVRTTAEQQAAFAKGRTIPGENVRPGHPLGDTVTKADGVTHRSNHQVHADKLGHAVDLCFMVNGQPSWRENLPWTLYGEMAKSLGLKWGGDWPSRDQPHIELP